MKICIPTMDDRGLDGTASDHFGSAPFFTVVNTDDGTFQVIDNREAHAHGVCSPLDRLGGQGLDAIACRGMGRRAILALAQNGVGVLLAESHRVAEIIDAAKRGALRPLDPANACGGGGHGHCQH
jgi:predicted Fe-Mo cluster-binding NifX family protein